MAYSFNISSNVLPSGRTAYYAKLTNSTDPKFTIGYRTKYLDNFGLYNIDTKTGMVYLPDAYRATYGFWADFIYPTAYVESRGSFFCFNTYDRAKFTFGFLQYAAHVPNGDFVQFLRALLKLPLAPDYFPRLELKENRIHYRHANQTLTPLESDTSTQALMDYLNPSLLEIDTQETICTARMVHWAQHDEQNRLLQVRLGIDHYQANMPRYHNRLNLHQAPAKVCLVVCDILHQGRGTFDRIASSLNTNGNWEQAYNNLLIIGNSNYSSRINSLKRKINEGLTAGVLNRTYNAATNSFV